MSETVTGTPYPFLYPIMRFFSRSIKIDEICIGKGHRYVTLVMDLDSGAILFVRDGKSADSLVPFWERLGRRRSRIEAVAIDMSSAYISAVQDNLPQADETLLRFIAAGLRFPLGWACWVERRGGSRLGLRRHRRIGPLRREVVPRQAGRPWRR